MSEIPEDVMRTARGCFCAKEVGAAGTMPLTLARIARAIMAEREACAKAADSWASTAKRIGQIEAETIAEDIAHAIREPIPMTNPKPGERE